MTFRCLVLFTSLTTSFKNRSVIKKSIHIILHKIISFLGMCKQL